MPALRWVRRDRLFEKAKRNAGNGGVNGRKSAGLPPPILLLHFDGSNGGTTFTDHGINARTITRWGTNTTTSTVQSKFGGAALLQSGNSTGIGIAAPLPTDLRLGANDFVVDFWLYCTNIRASAIVRGRPNGSQAPWSIFLGSSGYVTFESFNNNATPTSQANCSTGAISANVWTHICFSRVGSSLRSFRNGVRDNTVTSTELWAGDSTSELCIGDRMFWGYTYGGYIDEFRIVSGAGITDNFTPPDAPYANP